MPRFPKFFGRKQSEESDGAHTDQREAAATSPNPAATVVESSVEPLLPDEEIDDPKGHAAAGAGLAEGGAAPLSDASSISLDRRTGTGSALIGGEEEDLVPLIPNTDADTGDGDSDLDEESFANATVDALMGACKLMVGRVNAIRRLEDGSQIVAGLIALVGELDAQYTSDWGVVRRNGLEEMLVDVRQSAAEGDRFILESLENGRGGLTAEVFLRDLRTIAPSDRPRMVANYALFLIFVISRVLRQYLQPLVNDPVRLREVTRRLDYLVDGVRDSLLARITSIG